MLHEPYEVHFVIEKAIWAGHLTFKWVCHNDESTGAQAIKKTTQRLSACVTEIVCHFITESKGGKCVEERWDHIISKLAHQKHKIQSTTRKKRYFLLPTKTGLSTSFSYRQYG